MELDGASTLVTGATDGVGRALAERLAAEGARLALVSDRAEPVEKLAGEIGAHAVVADVTDLDQVTGLATRIERTLGPLDLLVNVANTVVARFVANFSQAELQRIVAGDLLAPMQLCGQVVPGMVARGSGCVVNMSSAAAHLVVPGISPHAAANAGLAHFTACLRAELRGTNVRTTLVELGPVRPDQIDGSEAYAPTRLALARLRRFGLLGPVRADDVADVVVDALRRDRVHVRLPRSVAVAAALAEIPRRLSEWGLAGAARAGP